MEERLQTDDTVKMIYSGATFGEPDVQELGRRNGKGNGEMDCWNKNKRMLKEEQDKQVELGDTPVKKYKHSIPIKMNNKNEFIIEYFLIF